MMMALRSTQRALARMSALIRRGSWLLCDGANAPLMQEKMSSAGPESTLAGRGVCSADRVVFRCNVTLVQCNGKHH